MKRLFNISLSSRLNFSLTKRRLSLIGKATSVRYLYFKTLPVLLAFALSPFFFFDLQEEPIEAFSVSHEESWANKTYSDVNLKRKSLLADEENLNSPDQILYVVLDENEEPYTGIERFYSKETDVLTTSNVYVDGLPVNHKTFGADGTEQSSIDILYDPLKTTIILTRYYELGSLISETVFSSSEHQGMNVYRVWNPNGNLITEMIFETFGFVRSNGELKNYDQEGNLVLHERYKDGELVEKIK